MFAGGKKAGPGAGALCKGGGITSSASPTSPRLPGCQSFIWGQTGCQVLSLWAISPTLPSPTPCPRHPQFLARFSSPMECARPQAANARCPSPCTLLLCHCHPGSPPSLARIPRTPACRPEDTCGSRGRGLVNTQSLHALYSLFIHCAPKLRNKPVPLLWSPVPEPSSTQLQAQCPQA